jgi:hypothetical protein
MERGDRNKMSDPAGNAAGPFRARACLKIMWGPEVKDSECSRTG